MNDRRRILVVARQRDVAQRLVSWLDGGGSETTLVTTFAEATAHLESRPDLVVTEVKLGEYNGLHIALKADAAGIPAIVIGTADAVLQKDAESIHAIYLTTPDRTALLEAIARQLTRTSAPHRSPALPFRAHVTTIAAEADVMWRAFSESPASELSVFGRMVLPI